MITFIGDIAAITVTAIFTFGLAWICYPAWAVLIAENLEWKVERLSPLDTELDELPILSIVIPAYNEQDRIPSMLCESFNFLISMKGKTLLRRLQACVKPNKTPVSDHRQSNILPSNENNRSEGLDPSVEWLIVNDGSTDSTCEVVRKMYKETMNTNYTDTDNAVSSSSLSGWTWQIVSLQRNFGKGAAVKVGMNLANGLFHLMVDADGATGFEQGLENLIQELEARMKRISITALADGGILMRKTYPMIAIFGSRAHLEKESTAQRSPVRTLLMKAFHFFVSLFVSTKVHDTQCGFKIFTKFASYSVFEELHLRRWAFDTEIVVLCDKLGIDISEVAVPWKEIDGSKLSTSKLALAFVSISMLRDMICVWACYSLGIWRAKTGYKSKDRR